MHIIGHMLMVYKSVILALLVVSCNEPCWAQIIFSNGKQPTRPRPLIMLWGYDEYRIVRNRKNSEKYLFAVPSWLCAVDGWNRRSNFTESQTVYFLIYNTYHIVTRKWVALRSQSWHSRDCIQIGHRHSDISANRNRNFSWEQIKFQASNSIKVIRFRRAISYSMAFDLVCDDRKFENSQFQTRASLEIS